MLDLTHLRKDLDTVVARLQTRKNPQPFLDVAAFSALEHERKALQVQTEELQAQRNRCSKQIGVFKGQGQHAQAEAVMAEVGQIKAALERSAARLEQIQSELQAMLLALPNLPQPEVPLGPDESANVELRRWAPGMGIGNPTA